MKMEMKMKILKIKCKDAPKYELYLNGHLIKVHNSLDRIRLWMNHYINEDIREWKTEKYPAPKNIPFYEIKLNGKTIAKESPNYK